jgi:hypothetical protein
MKEEKRKIQYATEVAENLLKKAEDKGLDKLSLAEEVAKKLINTGRLDIEKIPQICQDIQSIKLHQAKNALIIKILTWIAGIAVTGGMGWVSWVSITLYQQGSAEAASAATLKGHTEILTQIQQTVDEINGRFLPDNNKINTQ